MDPFEAQIREGIPASSLPSAPQEDPSISRAPKRAMVLSDAERALALRNALRYFPSPLHAALAGSELPVAEARNRIMGRLRPIAIGNVSLAEMSLAVEGALE